MFLWGGEEIERDIENEQKKGGKSIMNKRIHVNLD